MKPFGGFKKVKKLSVAGNNPVYLVKDTNGEEYALKMVNPRSISFGEIDILFRVSSDYIIKGIDLEASGKNLGIVQDLAQGNMRFKYHQPEYTMLKKYMLMLVLGLDCLHSKGFLHLDIKPENCLYSDNNAYLADFGNVVRTINVEDGIKTVINKFTKPYAPPEFLGLKDSDVKVYNQTADVWSLGQCFLYFFGFRSKERLSLKALIKFWKNFYKTGRSGVQARVKEIIDRSGYTLDAFEKFSLIRLISNMIDIDPDERPSVSEILKHGYFHGMKLKKVCFTKKDEVYYIPHITPDVFYGIGIIQKAFLTYEKESTVRNYFLAIDIFMRVVQKIPPETKDSDIDKLAYSCALVALTYFEGYIIPKTRLEHSLLIAEILKGKIGLNKYYDEASSLDQLIAFENFLGHNKWFFNFYTVANPKKVFKYLDEAYVIKPGPIKILSFKEYQEIPIPKKRRTQARLRFNPGMYSFAKPSPQKHLKNSKIKERYISIENELKEKLCKCIESVPKYKIKNINQILDSSDVESNFNEIVRNRKIKLSDAVKKCIPELNNPNFEIIYDRNSVSLLVYNEKKRTVKHFYSSGNRPKIKPGYDYIIDQGYYIFACQIIEVCILTSIYISVVSGKEYNISMLRGSSSIAKLMLSCMYL